MSSFSSIHKSENSEKSSAHGSTPSVLSGPPPAHGASMAKRESPLLLMSDHHRSVTPDTHNSQRVSALTPAIVTPPPNSSSILWSPAASLNSKIHHQLNSPSHMHLQQQHRLSPKHLVQPLPPPSLSSSSHVQMRGSPLDPLMSRPPQSSSSSPSKLDAKSSAPPKAHQGSPVTVHAQGPNSGNSHITYSHMYLAAASAAATSSVLRSSSNTAHQSSLSSSSSRTRASPAAAAAADAPVGKESIGCFKGNNNNNNNSNNSTTSGSTGGSGGSGGCNSTKSGEVSQTLKTASVTSLGYLPSSLQPHIYSAIPGFNPASTNGHRIASTSRTNGHMPSVTIGGDNCGPNNVNNHFNSALTKSNFMSVDSLISKGDCVTNSHSTTSTASSALRGQEVISNCLPPAGVHRIGSPLGQVISGQWPNGKSFFGNSAVASCLPPSFQAPSLPPPLNIFPVISTGQPNLQPPAAHSRPSNVHHQPPLPPASLPPTHHHHHHRSHSHSHQHIVLSSSSSSSSAASPSPSSSSALSNMNNQANENIHNIKNSTNGGSNSPHRHHLNGKNSSKELSDHKRHKQDIESTNVNNISRINNGNGSTSAGVVVRHSSTSIHDLKNLAPHLHHNHLQQQQQQQKQQAGVNHSSKLTSVVSSASDASQFPCAPFDSLSCNSSSSSGGGGGGGGSGVGLGNSSTSCSSSQHSTSSSLGASAAAAAAATAAALAAHSNSNSLYLARLKSDIRDTTGSSSSNCTSDHSNMYGIPAPPPPSSLMFTTGHPAYRAHPSIPGLPPFPIVLPEPSGHCDTSSALPLTSKESTTRVLQSSATPNSRLVAPALPNCTQHTSSFSNKLPSASSSSPSTFLSSSASSLNKSQLVAKDSTVMNENSSEYLPQPPSSISPSNSTTSSNSSSSGGAKFHKKAWVQKYQHTAQDTSCTLDNSIPREKENGTNNSSSLACSASTPPASINASNKPSNLHDSVSVSGENGNNVPSSSLGPVKPSHSCTPAITVDKVDPDIKSKSSSRNNDESTSDNKNCASSGIGKKTNSRSLSKASDKSANGNKRLKKSHSDSDGDNTSTSPEETEVTVKGKASVSTPGKRKKTKEIDCDLTDEDTVTVKSEEKNQTTKKKRTSKGKKENTESVDEQQEEETSEDTVDGKVSSKNGKDKSSSKSSSKQSKKCKDSSPDEKLSSGEVYLQDKSCSELGSSKGSAKQISRCIECNMTPKQKAKKEVAPSVFCRFYQFRKLVCNSPKGARAAGFSEPKDAKENDVSLWMLPGSTGTSETSEFLKVDDAKFLIELVGDHFCKLVEQEAFAMSLHMGSARMAWKSVVAGVREMCDVCATTLFNIHWFCADCGFVVCIDCYAARKELESGTSSHSTSTSEGSSPRTCTSTSRSSLSPTKSTSANSNKSSSSGHHVSSLDSASVPKATDGHEKDKDTFGWLLCNSKDPHSQVNLVLTQIIARTALWDVCKRLHAVRRDHLKQQCKCGMDAVVDTLTAVSSTLFALPEPPPKETQVTSSDGNSINANPAHSTASVSVSPDHPRNVNTSLPATSPLSILADVAINAEKQSENYSAQIQSLPNHESISSDDDRSTSIFAKLRQLLQNTTTALASSVFKCNSQANSGSENSCANQHSTTGNSAANSGKKGKGKKITLSSTQLNGVIKCDNNSNNGKSDESSLKYFKRQIKPIFTSKNLPSRGCSYKETSKNFPEIPHDWYCDGQLLVLKDTGNDSNIQLFQQQWIRHQPAMVTNVHDWLERHLWTPKIFREKYADTETELVNTETGETFKCELKQYWDGFENLKRRKRDDESNQMILKLKDWPPGEDFSEALPDQFNDLISCIPMPEYTTHEGPRNLAGRFPRSFGLVPDLGPKMYTAYGLASDNKGTTNLHLDMSDAVNIMVYVATLKSKEDEKLHQKNICKALQEANVEEVQLKRMKEKKEKPGALWHIYDARDADKIRDMLNGYALKKGEKLLANADPIHDQSYYLNKSLRQRLKQEYKVEGYTIVQYWGDAVFIPAGAPHQVRNLSSCIKVAEDFVSPENVAHCFNLTEEFRQLSPVHANHEDKLQIKNIIYHAVKDALASFPS